MYCQHLLKKGERLIIGSNWLKLKVKSDSQQLWKNIGELSRIKTIKDSFPIAQFEQGKYIKDKENVLKFPIHLNKYYISVTANLESDVPAVVVLDMVNDMDYRVVSDVRLEPVSEDEIVEVVNDLRGGASLPAVDVRLSFPWIS